VIGGSVTERGRDRLSIHQFLSPCQRRRVCRSLGVAIASTPCLSLSPTLKTHRLAKSRDEAKAKDRLKAGT